MTNGAYVYGYSTPVSAVPLHGKALHRGEVRGTAIGPSGAVPLVGWGNVTIDFGSHAVAGSMTEMRQGTIWDGRAPFAKPFDSVAIAGMQSGNQIAGTTSVTTAPASPLSLSAGATGHFNGELFGHATNEMGAVWTLSDGTRSAMGIFIGPGHSLAD
jgi:hypothetical protein